MIGYHFFKKKFRGLIMKNLMFIETNNFFNSEVVRLNASFDVKLNFLKESFLILCGLSQLDKLVYAVA